jgi:hypothetical protein
MIDSFYIGAYWGSRARPLEQVIDKVLQTLQKLAEIDMQFLNWHEGGNSRKQALKKAIELNHETIEKLCLQKVKKGELDENRFAKMGFLFGLWSGHQDEESSSISFNVGGAFTSPHLSNSCVITIPFEGAARERLLQVEKAKKIICVLVDIWTPDYSVLASSSLNNKLNVVNDIGWVTYYKSIRRIPKTSNKVVYEKYDSGHLFYLANEASYDYSLAKELLPLKEIIGVR